MKLKGLFKHSLILSLLFYGALSQLAFAQGRFRHAMGFEQFYYNYTEVEAEKNDAYFMSLRGPMVAFVGDLEYQPENWWVSLRLEGRAATSIGNSLRYESLRSGQLRTSSNYVEGRLLSYFDIHREWRLFIGPGVRYLINDSDGQASTTGHTGYLRKNLLLYIAQGIEHRANLAHRWQMVSQAEYDVLVQGWQYSGIYDGVHNKQDKGYGFRIGTQFIKPCQSYDLAVGPFFRYWKIDKSDIVPRYSSHKKRTVGIYEPKNSTKELGVQVRFSLF